MYCASSSLASDFEPKKKKSLRPSLPGNLNVHTGGASRDPPAFLQTLELALARVLGLALHEVIVVGAAPGADEEGGGEEGRGGGADLLHGGDRVG